MRILGIDPGLAVAGVGLVTMDARRRVQAEDWLAITTPAGMPLPERLRELAEDLEAYLAEAKPDLAVVEKLFFAANKQSAIDVSQARGVILVTLAKRGIRVLEPTPLQLKSCVTGDGRADKRQVQDMVVRTLKLDEIPTPVDAADALALALYGAFTSGANDAAARSVPTVHRRSDVVGKVRGRQERLAAGK